MGTNTVTLNLKGTSDISLITRDMRLLATETKNAGTPLNQLTTSLDKSSKSATTFGQKIRSFGSNFGQLSASVGSLAGSVVGLTRQYQDLGDSQIRIDRVTLKLSRSQEALRAAQAKLAALQDKGITSGKEYEKALLDVQQAEDAVKIQTDLLREAQEDHQRAQENFWIGLVPTITSAAGTIMGVLQNMMGAKGFGGVATAVGNATAAITGGGVGGKGGGAGGLLAALGRIAVPTALVGGGLFAAGGIQQAAGPEFQKGAQAAGAFELASLKNIGFTRDQIMGLRGAIEAFNSTFGLTTATVEQVDAALAKLNGTAATTTSTATKINTNFNSAAVSTSALANAIVKLKTDVAEGRITAEQFNAAMIKLRTGHEEAYNAANREADTLLSLHQVLVPVTQETEKAAAASQTAGQGFQGMAESVKFLDANFQPLPPLATQLAEALGQANASLGVSVDIGDQYVAQLDERIQKENDYQVALFQKAKSLEIANIHEDEDVRILELLIEAQRLAAAGAYDLAAAKTEEARKMQKAYQAAKQYTNLIPISANLPKGPRNPNYRIRADYQAPIVKGKPRPIQTRIAQKGMNELLRNDTMIMAHKGEHARITPPGKGGGAGSGIINVGPIYLDGEQIMGRMRYKINANSGVMK